MEKRRSLVLPLLLGLLLLCIAAAASLFLFSQREEPLDSAPTAPASPDSPAERTGALQQPPELETAEIHSAEEARSDVAEAPQADERSDAADAELAEAIWVDGRVRIPERTPPGETVFVIARGRKFRHRENHRARVERDGSFRVAFASGTKAGKLSIDAPHLYLDEPLSLDFDELPASIELAPALGGRVLAHLVPAPRAETVGAQLIGKPVQAWGRLRESGGQGVPRGGTVDADLRFELRGLPPALVFDLQFEPPEIAPIRRDEVRVEAGADLALELTYHIGGRASGRVVDEHGAAVPNARVRAMVTRLTRGGSWSSPRDVKLESDGSFDVRGLDLAKVELRAECTGYVAAELDLGEVEDGSLREDVELLMKRGNSVAGRVQWRDGRPAPTARVSYDEPGEDSQRWNERDRSSPVQPDGRFTISGLGEGPFVVTASARPETAAEIDAPSEAAASSSATASTRGKKKKPLAWIARAEGVRAGERELVLVLEQGRSIAGTVVDDAGTPLERFTVAAIPREVGDVNWSTRGELNRTFRDAGGRFTFEGLHDGRWNVRVKAEGHVPSQVRAIELPRDSEPFAFTLGRSASVAGIVLGADRRPVPRASVSVNAIGREFDALPYDWQARHKGERADADGGFRVAEAPIGQVEIFAQMAGYAESVRQRMELAPGQHLEGLVLELRQGGTVRGELRGRDGESVSERQVTLQPAAGGGGYLTIVTDPAGHFLFEHVPAGQYQASAEPSAAELDRLRAGGKEVDWALMQSARKSARVDVVDGAVSEVVLGSPPSASVIVSGVVRRGAKVAGGARVSAYKHNPTGAHQQKATRADEEGRYSLELEEPGPYSFSIASGDTGTHISRPEAIPEVASYRLDLELPIGRIAGRVVGPKSEPLAGMKVGLAVEPRDAQRSPVGVYGSTSSDAEGRFAFDDLPKGTYALSAGDQHAWAQLSPAARFGLARKSGLALDENGSIEGVELRLELAGQIEGRVLAVDGSPSVGASIFVRDERGTVLNSWSTCRSDAIGGYRIGGLTAGTYTLSARSSTDASAESAAVRVAIGGRAEVDLALLEGTFLRARAQDAAGNAIGASFAVYDERGREYANMSTWTERQDRGIGPIPPGRYRVTVENHGGGKGETSVDVHGQDELEVVVTLGQ